MTDTAYERAVARKERLLKELEEVNNFLRLYSRFARKTPPKIEGGDASYPQDSMPLDNPNSTGIRVTSQYVRRKELTPILTTIILKNGRPMTRSEIATALAAEGYPIMAKDASKNIGTIMWRLRDQFVNIEGRGYWPRGVSLLVGEDGSQVLKNG